MGRKERREQARQKAKELRRVQLVDLTQTTSLVFVPGGSPNEKCYAKCLGNCDGPMSLEHFISRNILEQMEKISPQGIPWLKDLDHALSPKSLSVKSLCKKHNSALDPLDKVAGNVFSQILRFSENHEERVRLPGKYFELWMLKCLLGYLSSEKCYYGGRLFTTEDLGEFWIKVLFGIEKMPNRCGLYTFPNIGDKVTMRKEVAIASLHDPVAENKLMGMDFEFAGIKFSLLLKPHIPRSDGAQALPAGIFHLTAIHKDGPQSLEFIW